MICETVWVYVGDGMVFSLVYIKLRVKGERGNNSKI